MSRSIFGGYSRARDGCIVTYRMPDGTIEVRHFSTVISDSRLAGIKKGKPHTEQLVEWADQRDAKIVCISTPETIARDLNGTRASLEPQRDHKHPSDVVFFPERWMVGNRGDLLELPGSWRA